MQRLKWLFSLLTLSCFVITLPGCANSAPHGSRHVSLASSSMSASQPRSYKTTAVTSQIKRSDEVNNKQQESSNFMPSFAGAAVGTVVAIACIAGLLLFAIPAIGTAFVPL